MQRSSKFVGGILALAIGCYLLGGTVSELWANPLPNPSACPDTDISQATAACISSANVCDGQAKVACTLNVRDSDKKYHVETFPNGCVTNQTGKLCNLPLVNCSIVVSCKFIIGEDGAPDKCVEDVQSGVWTQVAKPTPGLCSTN